MTAPTGRERARRWWWCSVLAAALHANYPTMPTRPELDRTCSSGSARRSRGNSATTRPPPPSGGPGATMATPPSAEAGAAMPGAQSGCHHPRAGRVQPWQARIKGGARQRAAVRRWPAVERQKCRRDRRAEGEKRCILCSPPNGKPNTILRGERVFHLQNT